MDAKISLIYLLVFLPNLYKIENFRGCKFQLEYRVLLNFTSTFFLQLQKALSNTENERRVLSERLDSCQQSLAEFRRNNQILQDQVSRLNNDLANNEVQKSALESQLRLAQWPSDGALGSSHHEDDLMRQLQSVQRERSELRGKVESLNSKVG